MCAVSNATILPQIITGVAGLLGALIGGGATLMATHLTTKRAARRARLEVVRAKGEELVSLLCGVGDWHSQVTLDAVETSREMVFPQQPYKAQALTEAYFPAQTATARKLIQACIDLRTRILEIRTGLIIGKKREDIWGDAYQTAYKDAMETASTLRSAVLEEMRQNG